MEPCVWRKVCRDNEKCINYTKNIKKVTQIYKK